MNARKTWANRLMALVLLAALAGFLAVGQVAATHCAPSVLRPLPVRENSWARFYQYSLASSGEATGSEITYGKTALASLVCDGEEVLPDLGEDTANRELDSLEIFELYLIGLGLELP
jgi:hypothetical protein